jgi:hypothetical protein
VTDAGASVPALPWCNPTVLYTVPWKTSSDILAAPFSILPFGAKTTFLAALVLI